MTPEQLKAFLLTKRKILPNGCWEWTGGTSDKRGEYGSYGIVKVERKILRVHRFMFHLETGFDLNSKMLICHRCDYRLCFNPEHLFEGTNKDNIHDMLAKGRHMGPAKHFAKAKKEHRM